MKRTLLGMLLLGSSAALMPSAMAQPNISIGIGVNIGRQPRYVQQPGYVLAPPPPPRYVRVLPRRPRGGYVWVPGYWYPGGRDWRWRDGYWAQPPRGKKRWVAPAYRNQRYYSGYWR